MRLTVSVAPVSSAPVEPALAEQAQRDRHGGILLAAGGRARVVLHRHDLARVDQLIVGRVLALEAGLDLLDFSDERDLNAQFLSRADRAFDDLLRGLVPAHGVYDDPHGLNISFASISSMIASERFDISRFLFRFPFTRRSSGVIRPKLTFIG